MGDNDSEHMRQLFVAARIQSGGRSLNEIYKHVNEYYPLPCSIAEMVQLELDTEREMLVPIVATRQLIGDLRKKGNIMFVSDMYLPDDFLIEILTYHGFFHEGDKLYVSDSVGAWKHDGSIFQLIHEKENIPYRHWHHYGDNPHSDYQIPKHLGIHAHHLYYDYLYYERQWRQTITAGFQYPQILAGICRATRLMSNAPECQKSFVANISSPFMISWTLYILNDAKQRGIRRLYFLARDVHSEYLIAKSLIKLFPEIEIKYLFISRKALSCGTLAKEFLQEEGVFDGTPGALVDSWSTGHTSYIINNMIAKHGGIPIHSYLIVKIHSTENLFCVNEDSVFNDQYLNTIIPQRINRVLGMRIFFELLFSLNFHHTIHGYEYHGKLMRPIFGQDDNDEWFFDNMNYHFAKKNNDLLLQQITDTIIKTNLHQYYVQMLEHFAIPTLIDYIDCPRREYTEYLHHFIWFGKPFVGHIMGDSKGVWARGNRGFCIPRWIINTYYELIKHTTIRKKINQFASWIPCPTTDQN